MDSDGFSAYSDEQEVLLQDGIRYEILDKSTLNLEVENEENGGSEQQQCHYITLRSIGDRYTRSNFFGKFV